MASIHSTAIVDPQAELAASVSVGPYAVIGPHVRVGEGSTIGAHCVIEGRTTIGRDNRIFQFASIGAGPQDKKDPASPPVAIGAATTIRDSVPSTWATAQDSGVIASVLTTDKGLRHLATTCNWATRSSCQHATLAGTCHIGYWVIIGGLTGVHQFTKIGAHAMAGLPTISQDVPPFMMVAWQPPSVRGFNVEGSRRRGFSAERIAAVKQMHKSLYRGGKTLQEACNEITALRDAPPEAQAGVDMMLGLLAQATRGIAR